MTERAELLSPERVRCHERVASKKRALERAAELLSPAVPGMTRVEIFDALNARERLGSTGLGHGMALPHGRVAGVKSPTAACLTLDQPIDYDAPDRQRVDILFALLVPRACNDEHLRILSSLAEMFNDETLRNALREQTAPQALIDCLANWSSPADTNTRAG